MRIPQEPEKQPEGDSSDTEAELPLWIKSLEKMRPELVRAILHVSADYNLPIQGFIEDALREKLERYLFEHPEIRALVEKVLEQQKKPKP
jgi:hypothetical protein